MTDDVTHMWVWPEGTAFTSSADGLINDTWLAHSAGQLVGVLQRLNTDIFVPQVHEDIAAVTEHVASQGLLTPRLIPSRAGTLWATVNGGVWRRLSPVGERTQHQLNSPAQAEEAGRLVGRFHSALSGFEWSFRSVRAGAHDTDAHMLALQEAVGTHRSHRLFDAVAPLAERIVATWQTWGGHKALPKRVIHGDLKVSNLRWQGESAVAVIDLDTMQMGTLAVELGDAFRSWCNPAGENVAEAVFDLDLFCGAIAGYQQTGSATVGELAAIVPGIERIAVELAARFARDALLECYFGFDPAFGPRGEHNLLRARGQLSLALSVRAQRQAAQALIRPV